MQGALSAEAFLDEVGSNGLLVEREKDRFAFAHLTFQEFLAAAHFRDTNFGRALASRVNQPWWRETTLLYAAGADADPIVRTCLQFGTITALSLICPRPIPTGLYRLFLDGTGTPAPDGPCSDDPRQSDPVSGLWPRDAKGSLAPLAGLAQWTAISTSPVDTLTPPKMAAN